MLWTIFTILLVLWLLGFLVGNIGAPVHLILVVAAAILVFRLVGNRRNLG